MVDVSVVYQCGECLKTHYTENKARMCCMAVEEYEKVTIEIEKLVWTSCRISKDITVSVSGNVVLKVNDHLLPIDIELDDLIDQINYNECIIEDWCEQFNFDHYVVCSFIESITTPSIEIIRNLIEQGKITYED